MPYFDALSNTNKFSVRCIANADDTFSSMSQAMSQTRTNAVLALAFAATFGAALLSSASAQITIFSEYFSDDLNQSNTAVDGWNLVANPYPAPVNLPAETLYEGRFVLHFNAMPAMELTSTTCDGLDIAELKGDWDAWDVA